MPLFFTFSLTMHTIYLYIYFIYMLYNSILTCLIAAAVELSKKNANYFLDLV